MPYNSSSSSGSSSTYSIQDGHQHTTATLHGRDAPTFASRFLASCSTPIWQHEPRPCGTAAHAARICTAHPALLSSPSPSCHSSTCPSHYRQHSSRSTSSAHSRTTNGTTLGEEEDYSSYSPQEPDVDAAVHAVHKGLKGSLRQLYRAVHPDLFGSEPEARADNERSLKLLQEYLSQARGGDPRAMTARLPYRFAFQLRMEATPDASTSSAAPASSSTKSSSTDGSGSSSRGARSSSDAGGASAGPDAATGASNITGGTQPAAAAAAAAPSAAANSHAATSSAAGKGATGMQRVEVVLPPPPPASAGSPPSSPSPSPSAADGFSNKSASGAPLLPSVPALRGLLKLFHALRIDTSAWSVHVPQGQGGVGGLAGGGGMGDGRRLRDFLPEAVEALRQAEASRGSDPAVRVANLRGALRMHHQVLVSFAHPSSLPPARQAAALAALARVVEALPLGRRLAGCAIVLGDTHGLDRLGQLCLGLAEPPSAWADLLGGVDLDYVRGLRAVFRALHASEASVAHALGIGQLFTSLTTLAAPSSRAAYTRWLEGLADYALGTEKSTATSHHTHTDGPHTKNAVLARLSVSVVSDLGADSSAESPPGSSASAGKGGSSSSNGRRSSSSNGRNNGDSSSDGGSNTGSNSRGGGGGLHALAHVDAERGLLVVSMQAAPQQVLHALSVLGPQALAASAARAQAGEKLRQQLAQVARALRLRTLTTDPRVSPAHASRCCALLMSQSEALRGQLEGAEMCIGFANRVVGAEGQGPPRIEIAWDTQL